MRHANAFLTAALSLLICFTPTNAGAQDPGATEPSSHRWVSIQGIRSEPQPAHVTMRESGGRPELPVLEVQQAVPLQNVRLTFHLIEANGFEDTDPAIADIVAELRDIFRFDGYRLLDSSVLRGVLTPDPDPERPAVTRVAQLVAVEDFGRLEIEAWIYETSDPRAVRVHVQLRSANRIFSGDRQFEGQQIIDASVTAQTGQTIVLGSGRPDSSAGALVLAMEVHLDE